MPLQDIKPVMMQAVTAMESLYGRGEGHALNWPLPVVQRQARLIWQLAIRRRMPLVWLLRNQSARKAVFTAACRLANIPPCRITTGELTERDFERLNHVVSHLSHAPVRLRDGCGPDKFRITCGLLASKGEFTYILCDWTLTDRELAFAKHLAAVTGLVFLCP